MTEKKKAVLVSKDADFLNFFMDLLGNEGYKALGSPWIDEKNLISFIKETDPDIIILDVMMPEMDGIGLGLILRRTQGLTELPIMLFSSWQTPQRMIRKYNPAITEGLTTPINLAEAIKLIEEKLQKNAAIAAKS